MTHPLEELAERCEKANGPDRELDCRIWVALGGANHSFEMMQSVVPCLDYWQAPYVTHSLDAAMKLAPDGWDKGVQDMRDRSFAEVWKHGWHDDTVVMSNGSTPALALVAASLRARAAEGKG